MNPLTAENFSVTQAIQLVLAPGVMINACGLLLLGIGNKFSVILNRIRVLNEEKRKLFLKAGEHKFSPIENQRLASIARQMTALMDRARLVRNALFCYFLAVGIFVATSLFIGFDVLAPSLGLRPYLLGLFLVGMCVVFSGIVFATLDTLKGYRVVEFEVMVDE
jgi:hypothetical protein